MIGIIDNPYIQRTLPMLGRLTKTTMPQPLNYQPAGAAPEDADNWKSVYYLSGGGGGGNAPAEYKQLYPGGDNDIKKLDMSALDKASNAKPLPLFRKVVEKVDGEKTERYEPYKELNSLTNMPEDAVMIYAKSGGKNNDILPQVFASGEVSAINKRYNDKDGNALPRLSDSNDNIKALALTPEEFMALSDNEANAYAQRQLDMVNKRRDNFAKKYNTAPTELLTYTDWSEYRNSENANRQKFENGPHAAWLERKREHELKYGGANQEQLNANYEAAKKQIETDRSTNEAIPAHLRKRVASTDGWSSAGTNNIISARPTVEKPTFVEFTEPEPIYRPLMPEQKTLPLKGEKAINYGPPKSEDNQWTLFGFGNDNATFTTGSSKVVNNTTFTMDGLSRILQNESARGTAATGLKAVEDQNFGGNLTRVGTVGGRNAAEYVYPDAKVTGGARDNIANIMPYMVYDVAKAMGQPDSFAMKDRAYTMLIGAGNSTDANLRTAVFNAVKSKYAIPNGINADNIGNWLQEQRQKRNKAIFDIRNKDVITNNSANRNAVSTVLENYWRTKTIMNTLSTER